MFERYEIPKYQAVQTAATSMYTAGIVTGTSIDIGYDRISVSAIYEGLICQHIHKFGFGGNSITHKLYDLIHSKVKNLPEYNEYSGLIFNLNRVKELSCYIKGTVTNSEAPSHTFYLPDGKSVKILRDELWQAPEELFTENNNIAKMVNNLINSSDLDIRRMLWTFTANGGTACIPGLQDRIVAELNHYATGKAKPKMAGNAATAEYASWIGGSILGSLTTFKTGISKQAYDECGPSIVTRMCF